MQTFIYIYLVAGLILAALVLYLRFTDSQDEVGWVEWITFPFLIFLGPAVMFIVGGWFVVLAIYWKFKPEKFEQDPVLESKI